MRFSGSEKRLSEKELARLEGELELKFPEAVRRCYLEANGGEPEPYVFSNDLIDTVVSELLPLKSKGRTALDTYRRLVLELKLVSPNFFPFAVDGGGDYFFVDCSSPKGNVFFYEGDSDRKDRLVDLRLGFADFWKALQPE